MSITPSLHIWSSIKIPLCGYSGRSRGRGDKSDAASSDPRKEIKQVSGGKTPQGSRRAEVTPPKKDTRPRIPREVVNLRVPSPLRRELEKSRVVPGRQEDHEKASCTLRRSSVPSAVGHRPLDFKGASCKELWNSNLSLIGVPNFDGLENRSADHSLFESIEDLFWERLSRDCDFDEKTLNNDSDEGKDLGFIPSVKPATANELQKLNQKHFSKEKELKNEFERKQKQKQRTKFPKNEPRASTASNSAAQLPTQEPLYQDSSTRDSVVDGSVKSFAPLALANVNLQSLSRKDYYEAKLAELYLIELGIKR